MRTVKVILSRNDKTGKEYAMASNSGTVILDLASWACLRYYRHSHKNSRVDECFIFLKLHTAIRDLELLIDSWGKMAPESYSYSVNWSNVIVEDEDACT